MEKDNARVWKAFKFFGQMRFVEVAALGWLSWLLFCPEAFIHPLSGTRWISLPRWLSLRVKFSVFLPSGFEKLHSWRFWGTSETLQRNYNRPRRWALPYLAALPLWFLCSSWATVLENAINHTVSRKRAVGDGQVLDPHGQFWRQGHH